MSLKKKATKKGDGAATPAEDTEDVGPDYSTQVSRVLLYLRQKSPISRRDLPMILEHSSEDTDFDKVWEQLKKSIYTKWEESTDLMHFEHELLNVKGSDLQDFIERKRAGISREELLEFNHELSGAVNELLRSAEVLPLLGWRGSNRKCLMMYPRGTNFKVPLTGKISVKPDSRFIETTHDLREEIRRGDAIVIDGKTYRVSAEPSKLSELNVKALKELIEELGGDWGGIDEKDRLEAKAFALMNEKGAASKQLSKKLASEGIEILEKLNEFSSSSMAPPKDAPKDTTIYKFEFDAKRLPLDRPYKGPALTDVSAYKHGCSNDIRAAYEEVANKQSNNYSVRDADRLDAKLLEKKLISQDLLDGINRSSREKREAQARRLAEAASGRPVKKQRRSTLIKKVTNVHMQN